MTGNTWYFKVNCRKAQESTGALELANSSHLKQAYMLDVDKWHTIDIYDQWLPKATFNASRGSSTWWLVMSGRCSTQMTLTKIYTEKLEISFKIVGGLSVQMWRYGGWDHLDVSCFALLIFSALDFSTVQMLLAWVFSPATGVWGSPCTRSTKRSPWAVLIGWETYGMVPLQLWNSCLIAFFSFLSIPTLVMGYAAQEVCISRGG